MEQDVSFLSIQSSRHMIACYGSGRGLTLHSAVCCACSEESRETSSRTAGHDHKCCTLTPNSPPALYVNTSPINITHPPMLFPKRAIFSRALRQRLYSLAASAMEGADAAPENSAVLQASFSAQNCPVRAVHDVGGSQGPD